MQIHQPGERRLASFEDEPYASLDARHQRIATRKAKRLSKPRGNHDSALGADADPSFIRPMCHVDYQNATH